MEKALIITARTHSSRLPSKILKKIYKNTRTIDIIVEANLKPFDILPLVPIIRNSGGIITDWNGKMDISKGNVIVAANNTLHKKFLFKLKNVKK